MTGLALAALALATAVGPALPQSWPSRPVKLPVGFTPGGGVDINARINRSRSTRRVEIVAVSGARAD